MFLFFRGKVLNDLMFNPVNGQDNLLMALQTLWQKNNPFTAVIGRVRLECEKSFFFQPAQNTGHGGVAEVEGIFDVPAAGRLGLTSQISHNPSLGRGQIHLRQGFRHDLIRAAMEHPEPMPVMFVHRNTSLNR